MANIRSSVVGIGTHNSSTSTPSVPQRFLDALNDRFETLQGRGFDGALFWAALGEQIRLQLEPTKALTTVCKGVRLHVPALGHFCKIQRQHCGTVLPPLSFQCSQSFLSDYDLRTRNHYPKMPGWVREVELSSRDLVALLVKRSGGMCQLSVDEVRRIVTGLVDLIGTIAEGNVPSAKSMNDDSGIKLKSSRSQNNSSRASGTPSSSSKSMPLGAVPLPCVGTFILQRRQLGFDFHLAPNPHLTEDSQHSSNTAQRLQLASSSQEPPSAAAGDGMRLQSHAAAGSQREGGTYDDEDPVNHERRLLALAQQQQHQQQQGGALLPRKVDHHSIPPAVPSAAGTGNATGSTRSDVAAYIPPALLSVAPGLSRVRRPNSAASSSNSHHHHHHDDLHYQMNKAGTQGSVNKKTQQPQYCSSDMTATTVTASSAMGVTAKSVGLPPRPSTAGSSSSVPRMLRVAPAPPGHSSSSTPPPPPTLGAAVENHHRSDDSNVSSSSRLTAELLQKLETSALQTAQTNRPELHRLGSASGGGGGSSYSVATKSSQLRLLHHPHQQQGGSGGGGMSRKNPRPSTAASSIRHSSSITPTPTHDNHYPAESRQISKLRDLCAATGSSASASVAGASTSSSLPFAQQLLQKQKDYHQRSINATTSPSSNPHRIPISSNTTFQDEQRIHRFAEAKHRKHTVDGELAVMESYLLDKYRVPPEVQHSMRQEGSIRRERRDGGGGGKIVLLSSGDASSSSPLKSLPSKQGVRHQDRQDHDSQVSDSVDHHLHRYPGGRGSNATDSQQSSVACSLGLLGADMSPERAHNQSKLAKSTHRKPPLAATSKVMSLALERHTADILARQEADKKLAQFQELQRSRLAEVDVREVDAKLAAKVALETGLLRQQAERQRIQGDQLYLTTTASASVGGGAETSPQKQKHVLLASDGGSLYQSYVENNFPSPTPDEIVKADPATKLPLGLIPASTTAARHASSSRPSSSSSSSSSRAPPHSSKGKVNTAAQVAASERRQRSMEKGPSKTDISKNFVALTHSNDLTPFTNPKVPNSVLQSRWEFEGKDAAAGKKHAKQQVFKEAVEGQLSVKRSATRLERRQAAKDEKAERELLHSTLIQGLLAKKKKEALLRDEQCSVWHQQVEERAMSQPASASVLRTMSRRQPEEEEGGRMMFGVGSPNSNLQDISPTIQ